MNRAFPPLGTEIGVIALERKPGLVLRRHGLTLAAFLWLMGERVGTKFCTLPGEIGCMCLPGAVV
ncbi:hypothetical protein [Salipiger sp.]|uniref:hypothetical protein n=1 Tax=Salipiger sp. TaxID=2078585 RepID=UPI003A980E09